MRFGSVLSEAFRSVSSGATHIAVFAAAAFALFGVLAGAEVSSVGSLAGQAVEYQTAAANVMVFAAPGAVDGNTCQSLTRVHGVKAAGALRSVEPLTLAALPASPVPAFDATPGFAAVIGAEMDASTFGVTIPGDLADTLSTRAGSVILTGDGKPLTIAGMFPFPSDGRATDLQNAVIQPVPADGVFDQCWVRIWPDDGSIVALARMTLTADAPPDTAMTTAQLNPTLGTSFNGPAKMRTRVTAYAWAAAAGGGLALGAISVWTRRKQLAQARHLGVTIPAQLLQTLTEAATIPLLALPPAAAVCALLTPATDTLPTWLLGLRILLAGSAAILFGAAIAACTIRGNALARYLKE